MTPTTLLAVREAVATIILATVPSHAEHRDAIWSRVRAIKDVPGGLRTFLVRPLPADETTDGIYGDGYEMVSVIQIWASYAGIEDDADGVMITADLRQLYNRLVLSATDAAVTGIVKWIPIGWTYEDETPGKVWGYHAFACHFLASDLQT